MWVLFPAPTWCHRTIHDCNSMSSEALLWPPRAPGTQVLHIHAWMKNIQAHTIKYICKTGFSAVQTVHRIIFPLSCMHSLAYIVIFFLVFCLKKRFSFVILFHISQLHWSSIGNIPPWNAWYSHLSIGQVEHPLGLPGPSHFTSVRKGPLAASVLPEKSHSLKGMRIYSEKLRKPSFSTPVRAVHRTTLERKGWQRHQRGSWSQDDT